jgi:signal transduction histidine kinase
MTATVILVGAGVSLVLFLPCAVRVRSTSRRRYAIAESLHELRGALAALQLGASVLEGHAPSGEEAAHRVDAVRTQIDRASVAVDDLDAHVTGSRGSSYDQTRELVELGEIVRRRALAWDRLADAQGGAVGLRWPLGPVLVRADPKRLYQALDNLIANGLDHGGGIVTLRGALFDGAVRISVSDRGPGFRISPHDLPRAPWNARHGHGLAIVNRAVEMNDGRLRATSRPTGANVEIELPLASPPAACLPARPLPAGTAFPWPHTAFRE